MCSTLLERLTITVRAGLLHRAALTTYPEDDGARVKIVQRIPHKGEVNRARYNPHNPSVVATHSVTGLVYVFDRAQHPTDADDFTPDLTLQGQGREGYGLAWSNFEDGHILSASEDTTVCLWDIKAQGTTLDPLCTFRGHTAVVEDVTFDPIVPTRFASVGDDRQLLLWDTRAGETPSERVEAGTGEISAVSWCRYAGGHVLATGGSDKLVRVWDVRSLGQPVHTLEGHTSEVLGLAFSPTEPTILASSGADRRVNVWDLSRIGMEQDAVDAEDGPPELFFQHGGHTAQPTVRPARCELACHILTSVYRISVGHLMRHGILSQQQRITYCKSGVQTGRSQTSLMNLPTSKLYRASFKGVVMQYPSAR